MTGGGEEPLETPTNDGRSMKAGGARGRHLQGTGGGEVLHQALHPLILLHPQGIAEAAVSVVGAIVQAAVLCRQEARAALGNDCVIYS